MICTSLAGLWGTIIYLKYYSFKNIDLPAIEVIYALAIICTVFAFLKGKQSFVLLFIRLVSEFVFRTFFHTKNKVRSFPDKFFRNVTKTTKTAKEAEKS